MFISTDITGPLSANMYAYCENNPVKNIDCSGAVAVHVDLMEGTAYRVVTDEVLAVLIPAADQGSSRRQSIRSKFLQKTLDTYALYEEFKELVNHYAPWDIKVPESWESTIGTDYPGYNASVIFDGEVMTPEELGNYTYGFLGYAYGIPLEHLLAGSCYAAGIPDDGADVINEINDWVSIIKGYAAACTMYGG